MNHTFKVSSPQPPTEKTVISPIERVQQFQERWTKQRAALMAEKAEREQRSPPKSQIIPPPLSPPLIITKSVDVRDVSPEFSAAIALASSSSQDVDEVAASLLLECWAVCMAVCMAWYGVMLW